MSPSLLVAENDERTLSLYETHLRETTTVTYKRNGRYIPAAMKKLNYALRDWRTGEPTRISPKLIDTIWELHKELGSTGPVQIISGYRSPKTNARLRRRGGGQARRSQHMLGNAMDVRFPGVSTKKLREAAMRKERGGVGYYPSSRFVHVDVARVRSWPRMSRSQLAMLFPDKATRHLPSGGGRLTRRDRYRARTRIAKLKARRGRPAANSFLARAKGISPVGKGQAPFNVALANNNGSPVSGLWINQGNNQRFAALDIKPRKHGHSHKKPAGQKDSIKHILSGSSAGNAKADRAGQNQSARGMAALAGASANEFQTEKIGYAPIYNDEDPEEIAYQPFSISPILKTGAGGSGLREPAYNRVDLASANMVFSAGFRSPDSIEGMNWSSEFRGKAVRNLIGKHAALQQGDERYRVATR